MTKRQRDAVWTGATLGTYKAHALAGPPATILLMATNHWWIAGIMAGGAAIGWAGWKRDFNLRWTP
jgi:hypothetical protein